MSSDQMDRLMAQRMYHRAMAYRAGVDRLCTARDPRPSEAAVFLDLLVLEILLKAVWRASNGSRPTFRHHYLEGWNGIGASVRGSVLAQARTRYGSRADLSMLPSLLPAWGRTFSASRYSYEAIEGMTDEELIERDRRLDQAIDEANTQAAVREHYTLGALIYGLRRWLEDELGVASDVTI